MNFKEIKNIVFISYAKEDCKEAALLNQYLKDNKFYTWIDFEQLVPGQLWKKEITKAISNSQAVIFLLSKNSINKLGFVQKELKEILKKLENYPSGDIVLILVRLDNSEPREEVLNEIQWVDLFLSRKNGYLKVLNALQKNAEQEEKRKDSLALPSKEYKIEASPDKRPKHSKKGLNPTKVENKKVYKSLQGVKGIIFEPDELDIYVNKGTLEAYIFHGKEVDYQSIKHLEINLDEHTLIAVYHNGDKYDVGVLVPWLVRPYLERADEVSIIRTKDGESIDGHVVPLIKTGKRKLPKGYKKNISPSHSLARLSFLKGWLDKFIK